MRRGDGGGPFRQLLSMIATLVMVGVLVVVLVSSGGWRTVSETLGVGNPDASTAALAESKRGMGTQPGRQKPVGPALPVRRPYGRGGGRGGEGHGENPGHGPDGDAAARRAQLDAAGRIGHGDVRWAATTARRGSAAGRRPAAGRRRRGHTILARDLTGARNVLLMPVVSGTLRDPYTGRGIGFRRGVKTSADVQIDHVVSLYDEVNCPCARDGN